jgi:hypothetical protein
MRWVTEYLRYEQACRDLASILTKPDDKRALELMATGWAARAAERKRKIGRFGHAALSDDNCGLLSKRHIEA